jgi:hypothetical protein
VCISFVIFSFLLNPKLLNKTIQKKLLGDKMKKIMIVSMLVILVFMIGCSNQSKEVVKESSDCIETEETYTEMQDVTTSICEDIKYSMTVVESEFKPYPNQADRQYDVATVTVSLLNQDNVGGDFEVEVEIETTRLGIVKESASVNLQSGSPEKLTIRYNGVNAGTILSIGEPKAVSVPKKDCKDVTEQKEVTKTRTVCN